MNEYINISGDGEKTAPTRPTTLSNLRNPLAGLENHAFVPEAKVTNSRERTLQVTNMSEKSGRGPAPLPRNSGAGSRNSSDEEQMYVNFKFVKGFC